LGSVTEASVLALATASAATADYHRSRIGSAGRLNQLRGGWRYDRRTSRSGSRQASDGA